MYSDRGGPITTRRSERNATAHTWVDIFTALGSPRARPPCSGRKIAPSRNFATSSRPSKDSSVTTTRIYLAYGPPLTFSGIGLEGIVSKRKARPIAAAARPPGSK
jgi:hypothetical protein